MATPSKSLVTFAIAGSTVLSAWRVMKRSDSRIRKLRALLSLGVAVASLITAFSGARNNRSHTA